MFNKTPNKTEPCNGGIQHLYFFPNGKGASVVRHDFSYGHEDDLWELAVLQGTESAWDLDYTTEITQDVLGHLTEDEVNALLSQIESLPE